VWVCAPSRLLGRLRMNRGGNYQRRFFTITGSVSHRQSLSVTVSPSANMNRGGNYQRRFFTITGSVSHCQSLSVTVSHRLLG
jgi:hypothetical protein